MRLVALALLVCACSEKKSEPPQAPVIIVTKNVITHNGKVIYLDAGERLEMPPRIELRKEMGNATPIGYSVERLLFIRRQTTSDAIIEVDPSTGSAKELFTTNDRLDTGMCDRKAQRCVVEWSKPTIGRDRHDRADPRGVLLLDGQSVQPLATKTAPNPEPASSPISPDGRFVVIKDHTAKGTVLVATDVASKPIATQAGADVVGWLQVDGVWVARIRTRDGVDEAQAWHIEGNVVKPTSEPTLLGPSPDGTRSATFADGKLTVTHEGKARVLELDPEAARYCEGGCAWVDNRLIDMRGHLIDTQTMMVTRTGYEVAWFVPGTRTAIVSTERGTFLATVILP